MIFRRGDIVFANMGSKNTTYHTQRGWRPAIVIAYFNNAYTVIPLTTKKKNVLPTHILISDKDVPVIRGDNVVLCENCTQLPDSCITSYKFKYNICLSNPDIWCDIIKGLAKQLTKKYDCFTEKVEPNHRRGSIVQIKGTSAYFIIVSNEKNNLYSSNLTIMPLRVKRESEVCLSAHVNNYDLCAPDSLVCINIAKDEIVSYIGYAGKGFANLITKEFLVNLQKEEE